MKKRTVIATIIVVCLLLAVGGVLLFSPLMAGCSSEATRSNAFSAGAAVTGMSTTETTLSEASEIPLEILAGCYYLGRFDGKDCVLWFDQVKGKSFSGKAYAVGTAASASPVSFSGTFKGRRCVLHVDQEKRVLKKIDITANAQGFSGRCREEGSQRSFNFQRYTPPTYQPAADTSRYHREYFDVEVVNNVKYGRASGYWVSRVENATDYGKIISSGISKTISEHEFDLYMDIYLPKGDTLQKRPLIMFIHGGGFFIGDKQDNPIVLWCKHFARMGYVVASINYRMGFRPSKRAIERCGYRAAQDAHAAMRFLVHNKDKYRINTDYLFAAGSSAGGITTLNLAFMRNKNRPEATQGNLFTHSLGDIETSGNDLKETFRIRCIANMWGSVHDISMIDNAKVSIISFHGNADQVVPYGYDVPFQDLKIPVGDLFFNKMYGSKPIHERARKLGYRQALHTFEGCGHAPHVDKNNNPTDKFYFIQKEMTSFFYKEFVPQDVKINHTSGQNYEVAVNEYALASWNVVGGILLSRKGNSVRVLWLDDAPEQRLEFYGRLKNGAAVADTLFRKK